MRPDPIPSKTQMSSMSSSFPTGHVNWSLKTANSHHLTDDKRDKQQRRSSSRAGSAASSSSSALRRCTSAPTKGPLLYTSTPPPELEAVCRFPFPERDLMTMRDPKAERQRAGAKMALTMEVCNAPWWPGKEKYVRFNPAFTFGDGNKLPWKHYMREFREEELQILRTRDWTLEPHERLAAVTAAKGIP